MRKARQKARADYDAAQQALLGALTPRQEAILMTLGVLDSTPLRRRTAPVRARGCGGARTPGACVHFFVSEILPHVLAEFRKTKSMAERAMAQLADEQLFVRINPAQNSIAAIVRHMAGNMLSRFTDFLTTDGEKPWRHRDSEFDDRVVRGRS